MFEGFSQKIQTESLRLKLTSFPSLLVLNGAVLVVLTNTVYKLTLTNQ